MLMLSGFLDPYMNPLLIRFGTLGFVAIISFVVSLITILVYKYTTNQNLMKQLKHEIDDLNKQAKKHIQDQKKAMQIQKQMFDKQMIMMKHSFTSTFITILPIFILFSWLNQHLNSDKILPLFIFGWKLGWLGSYILFALIFSTLLRKILKVY